MSKEQWLAAYLYYTEPFDHLLKDFVKPFAGEMIKLHGVSQFFFIRYWHRGPHIRLRFKGSENVLNGDVKETLEHCFKDYIEANPSERKDPQWVSKLDEENQWRPNNSIEFVEYEPEVERYGGAKAIKIAEQHFQDSSETVLKLLERSNDWDYEQSLGEAIKLHLTFVRALQMNTTEATLFFSYVYQSWFPRALSVNKSNLDEAELKEVKEKTLQAFQESFENQKEVLVSFCQNLWLLLQNERKIPEQLKDWFEGVQRTEKGLVKIQQNRELFIPAWFNLSGFNWNVSDKDQERWRIYQSYVHMTNNRLGILNRDEGFLGFLLKESFKQIGKMNNIQQ